MPRVSAGIMRWRGHRAIIKWDLPIRLTFKVLAMASGAILAVKSFPNLRDPFKFNAVKRRLWLVVDVGIICCVSLLSNSGIEIDSSREHELASSAIRQVGINSVCKFEHPFTERRSNQKL